MTDHVNDLMHSLNLQIVDARRIRAAVIDAFESACNPGQSESERKRLLNFVVVGGGPTGVEFAAELADLVHQDLHSSFPQVKPPAIANCSTRLSFNTARTWFYC
jgi:NADH dehydrogenase FAD-containing subunit